MLTPPSEKAGSERSKQQKGIEKKSKKKRGKNLLEKVTEKLSLKGRVTGSEINNVTHHTPQLGWELIVSFPQSLSDVTCQSLKNENGV